MSDFIDSFNHRDTAISAGVGCATGFVWSALAGQADLATGKGWAQATYGCAGSALNGASVYGISRYATRDTDTARQITAAWFGIQSAASFTNYLGVKNSWQEKPAFNAVAFPLNFVATPISSTFGLVLATFGEAENGFSGKMQLFGGSLIFHHKLCFNEGPNQAYQSGSIGHYCDPEHLSLSNRFHELGHMTHESILGDLGYSILYALNGGFLRPWSSEVSKILLAEGWASSYADKVEPIYSQSEQKNGD